jgi:riboflavin biosynthesis pyrimidine reductase
MRQLFPTAVDLARAVSALAERGHTNVLSEGGPGIAAQLATGYLFLRYRRR